MIIQLTAKIIIHRRRFCVCNFSPGLDSCVRAQARRRSAFKWAVVVDGSSVRGRVPLALVRT